MRDAGDAGDVSAAARTRCEKREGSCDPWLPKRARNGRRFLNPVPTMVGEAAVRVLPQYLRNQEETEPKKPLGPFVTDAGRVCAAAAEWVAGYVVRAFGVAD